LVDPWERDPNGVHGSAVAAGACDNIVDAWGIICAEVADAAGADPSGGFSMADGIVEAVAAVATEVVGGDVADGAAGPSGTADLADSSAAPDVAEADWSSGHDWADEGALVPISRASAADAEGAAVSAGAAVTAAGGLDRTSCFRAAEAEGAEAAEEDGAAAGADSACCLAFGASRRAASWIARPGAVDSRPAWNLRLSDFLTMLSSA